MRIRTVHQIKINGDNTEAVGRGRTTRADRVGTEAEVAQLPRDPRRITRCLAMCPASLEVLALSRMGRDQEQRPDVMRRARHHPNSSRLEMLTTRPMAKSI